MLFAGKNEIPKPNDSEDAVPEAGDGEEATAIEVSLAHQRSTEASKVSVSGDGDAPRYRYGFSLRKLVYLSIIVAASATTIAIVSKVQHHKKKMSKLLK